ncbi:MAG: Major facilitator superfamily [Candidatus Daviesbacteria bacterium GW2011_GWA1_41_61]|uniref:Major facilitator superfamily n=1 Tax=Candidatus Daviesbacteria bacterium GW2011_GWA2_40_9 TaxID=1618424 RepID=A0A0G0U3T6_9BACT|nr:MAG: major facilitator superfamily [Candidatus Daviesbacteria bacterium GW2011_GWC1_40_9]KKR83719.1 MAG: Major facilitator superfamily [Candidatus Daviesbacteria bacterium GW2011_GWA2_40_9]KKR93686.1 MAG: Major facilitator superfamily [Candidatus Daviesbacteria bacterium GW2011_GWB1_41_15]KKS15152.1 MAG: Major facilitator superfamily [Candidatus Daviesbacteria bacterium GW2011_GWA1_41_61]
MSEKPTYLAVISNRGFRSLWINQILVQLAYNTLNFALIVWVFKLIDSNLAVSALMLSIYLPAILFGIFAGVFVDVTDRKKIIILIDLLLAVSFVLFIFIKGSFLLILINTFFINTLAQFFMPSESSSIPMLVGKKQLFLANSLFSLTLYASFMLGYSVGGPILNIFGINTIFFLGAGMLAIAFLLAQNLPSIVASSVEKKFGKNITWSNLQKMVKVTKEEASETFRFIRGRLNIATAIALLSGIQGVVGILAVLMPSYLERVLRIHATDSSYFVMLPLGLGMVSGSLIVGRLFYNRPKRQVVIPAILGAGIIFLLIGAAPLIARIAQSPELPLHLTRLRYFFKVPSISFWFAAGAYLLGLFTVSVIVPCQTVLQENTHEKNRGKIFAVLGVIMTSVAALPVVLAGGLSDVFGTAPILFTLGVLVVALGLIARYPDFFFQETHLPKRVREFLGFGHWEKGSKLLLRKNVS